MKQIPLYFFSLAMIATVISPMTLFAKHAQVPGQPYTPHPYEVCFSVDSNLSYGMKDKMTNGSVINVQAFLKSKGYLNVEPTGYFGPLTFKAVKEFQKSYSLPQTGFFGPMSRAKMNEITCITSPAPKEVTVSITTDKKEYNEGEEVKMKITATNPTDKEVTLNFNTGCQTSYMIDYKYNSIAAMLCMQALTSQIISAHDSFTWEMSHLGTDYELKKGTHIMTGHVIDNGSATTTITVK